MKGRVVAALRPLDAFSVENVAHPGTPDVNHSLGWMELKWKSDWPVGKSTPVVFPHFTPQQRAWLAIRRQKGGMAHVLVQVHRDWLLFDGLVAARRLGSLTRLEMIALAEKTWQKFPDRELVEHLRRWTTSTLNSRSENGSRLTASG